MATKRKAPAKAAGPAKESFFEWFSPLTRKAIGLGIVAVSLAVLVSTILGVGLYLSGPATIEGAVTGILLVVSCAAFAYIGYAFWNPKAGFVKQSIGALMACAGVAGLMLLLLQATAGYGDLSYWAIFAGLLGAVLLSAGAELFKIKRVLVPLVALALLVSVYMYYDYNLAVKEYHVTLFDANDAPQVGVALTLDSTGPILGVTDQTGTATLKLTRQDAAWKNVFAGTNAIGTFYYGGDLYARWSPAKSWYVNGDTRENMETNWAYAENEVQDIPPAPPAVPYD